MPAFSLFTSPPRSLPAFFPQLSTLKTGQQECRHFPFLPPFFANATPEACRHFPHKYQH
jgi:hypothetical protein